MLTSFCSHDSFYALDGQLRTRSDRGKRDFERSDSMPSSVYVPETCSRTDLPLQPRKIYHVTIGAHIINAYESNMMTRSKFPNNIDKHCQAFTALSSIVLFGPAHVDRTSTATSISRHVNYCLLSQCPYICSTPTLAVKVEVTFSTSKLPQMINGR